MVREYHIPVIPPVLSLSVTEKLWLLSEGGDGAIQGWLLSKDGDGSVQGWLLSKDGGGSIQG